MVCWLGVVFSEEYREDLEKQVEEDKERVAEEREELQEEAMKEVMRLKSGVSAAAMFGVNTSINTSYASPKPAKPKTEKKKSLFAKKRGEASRAQPQPVQPFRRFLHAVRLQPGHQQGLPQQDQETVGEEGGETGKEDSFHKSSSFKQSTKQPNYSTTDPVPSLRSNKPRFPDCWPQSSWAPDLRPKGPRATQREGGGSHGSPEGPRPHCLCGPSHQGRLQAHNTCTQTPTPDTPAPATCTPEAPASPAPEAPGQAIPEAPGPESGPKQCPEGPSTCPEGPSTCPEGPSPCLLGLPEAAAEIADPGLQAARQVRGHAARGQGGCYLQESEEPWTS